MRCREHPAPGTAERTGAHVPSIDEAPDASAPTEHPLKRVATLVCFSDGMDELPFDHGDFSAPSFAFKPQHGFGRAAATRIEQQTVEELAKRVPGQVA